MKITGSPKGASRRGRPFALIRRHQFNVNLPVDMVAWLHTRALKTRRRLNVEVEEIIRQAAEGALEFIYEAEQNATVKPRRKIRLKKGTPR